MLEASACAVRYRTAGRQRQSSRSSPARKTRSKPRVGELLHDDLARHLADDEVAADIEQDMLQTAFDAAIAKADAIQFAVAVERGNENRRRVGLDRGIDEFFLAHHHAEIDDVEALFGQECLQNPVADRMAVAADNAEDDRGVVHRSSKILIRSSR